MRPETTWPPRFVRLLDRAFTIEHLRAPAGASYGAGSPISATELLESAIPAEEMEFYPEILVDEWAAQQLIDRELGLEVLLEFDVGDSERPSLVQYCLLELAINRCFLARKIDGRPLEFLVAADTAARDELVSASILAMLGAGAAFGEDAALDRFPQAVANMRPDIVAADTVRRGLEILQQRRPDSAPTVPPDFFASIYTEPDQW